MFKGAVEKFGFIKMLIMLLGFFFLCSLISGFILYKNLHTPLGPHFAAAHLNVTNLQDSLLIKNIVINLIFFCITALGVVFLGVLYSHKIAGPLIKVTKYAQMVGKGRFDQRISFRNKDAIHSLSAALNEMTQTYENKCIRLSSNLSQLEQNLKLIKEDREQNNEKIKKLLELDAIISKDYKDLIP